MTYTYQTESGRLESLLVEEVAALLREACDGDDRTPYHLNLSALAGWLPDKIAARVAYLALRRAGFTPTPDPEGDSLNIEIWDRYPAPGVEWKAPRPINLAADDLDLRIEFAARAIMGGEL